MCLYTYNNKLETDTITNNNEYELLSKIYKSIETNNNEELKLLTEQLISIQSSQEKIDTLQSIIDSLK